MTVCFNCGGRKFGAYKTCQVCRVAPRTTADHVYSLSLTEHYLHPKELDRISKTMRAGGPRPPLRKDFREKLGKDAPRYDGTVGPLYVADGVPDVALAAQLEKSFPRSLLATRKVIAASKAILCGRDHIEVRFLRLEAEVLGLRYTLEEEEYRPDLHNKPDDLVIAFFSDYSRAFPDKSDPFRLPTKFVPNWFGFDSPFPYSFRIEAP
jgi:hypothetical protein